MSGTNLLHGTRTESPTEPSPAAIGAQLLLTVKVAGKGAAGMRHAPVLRHQIVAPVEVYGIAVTSTTPMTRASAPVAVMASSAAS